MACSPRAYLASPINSPRQYLSSVATPCPPSPVLSPPMSPPLSPRGLCAAAVLPALRALADGSDPETVQRASSALCSLSGSCPEAWGAMLNVLCDPMHASGPKAVAASWLAQNSRQYFIQLPAEAQRGTVEALRHVCCSAVLQPVIEGGQGCAGSLSGLVASLCADVALLAGPDAAPWPSPEWAEPLREFCSSPVHVLRCKLLLALLTELEDQRLHIGPARRRAVRLMLREQAAVQGVVSALSPVDSGSAECALQCFAAWLRFRSRGPALGNEELRWLCTQEWLSQCWEAVARGGTPVAQAAGEALLAAVALLPPDSAAAAAAASSSCAAAAQGGAGAPALVAGLCESDLLPTLLAAGRPEGVQLLSAAAALCRAPPDAGGDCAAAAGGVAALIGALRWAVGAPERADEPGADEEEAGERERRMQRLEAASSRRKSVAEALGQALPELVRGLCSACAAAEETGSDELGLASCDAFSELSMLASPAALIPLLQAPVEAGCPLSAACLLAAAVIGRVPAGEPRVAVLLAAAAAAVAAAGASEAGGAPARLGRRAATAIAGSGAEPLRSWLDALATRVNALCSAAPSPSDHAEDKEEAIGAMLDIISAALQLAASPKQLKEGPAVASAALSWLLRDVASPASVDRMVRLRIVETGAHFAEAGCAGPPEAAQALTGYAQRAFALGMELRDPCFFLRPLRAFRLRNRPALLAQLVAAHMPQLRAWSTCGGREEGLDAEARRELCLVVAHCVACCCDHLGDGLGELLGMLVTLHAGGLARRCSREPCAALKQCVGALSARRALAPQQLQALDGAVGQVVATCTGAAAAGLVGEDPAAVAECLGLVTLYAAAPERRAQLGPCTDAWLLPLLRHAALPLLAAAAEAPEAAGEALLLFAKLAALQHEVGNAWVCPLPPLASVAIAAGSCSSPPPPQLTQAGALAVQQVLCGAALSGLPAALAGAWQEAAAAQGQRGRLLTPQAWGAFSRRCHEALQAAHAPQPAHCAVLFEQLVAERALQTN